MRERSRLLHIFKRYRILLRFAHTTVNRPGDRNRFIFASRRAVSVNDVGHFLRMGFTNRPPAKTAGSVSRTFTMPAFHEVAPAKLKIYSTIQPCRGLSLSKPGCLRQAQATNCTDTVLQIYSTNSKSLPANKSADSRNKMAAYNKRTAGAKAWGAVKKPLITPSEIAVNGQMIQL